MNPRLLASTFVVLLWNAPAWSQPDLPTDAEFVTKASVGNTFEVQEAQLALERSTDANLKTFAQKMIEDHGDAEKKLKAIADHAGLKVEEVLDKPHQAMLDNLKTMNGTDFDTIYKADQVQAHAETVALLSDYKQNGKNSDLTSWTDKTLPIVKMHRADINAM